MLTKVGVGYTSCQKEAVKDSRNITHSPVGRVLLRWYKKDKGNMSAEEEAELERKRKQAAERRALETKEQEKRDAARRQSASHAK
ncbi:MAG: hypothetical protein Q9208_005229 [Pyrenodesmia sp. 3 TL-2023]